VARMLLCSLPTLLHFCPTWRPIRALPRPSGLTRDLHLHDLTAQFEGSLLPGFLLEFSLWHVSCSSAACDLRRRPLPDKGKPAARRGRKAEGQAKRLTARLPKEGRQEAPRELRWSSAQKKGRPLCP